LFIEISVGDRRSSVKPSSHMTPVSRIAVLGFGESELTTKSIQRGDANKSK